MTSTTLRQAVKDYGENISLAALGAIEKKGDGEEVRVIYDATHGVLTNFLVRVRDLVRNPHGGRHPGGHGGDCVREVLALHARLRRVSRPPQDPSGGVRVGEIGLPN